MALENYRITEFQEKTQVDNGDYVLIDSATDGTRKYQLSRIPAQASAEVAAAVAAEETARNAAIGAAISEEVTARNAAIAANVDDTLTVSGKAADAKKTGDEIADVKSDLSDISDVLDIAYVTDVTLVSSDLENGAVDSNGINTGSINYRLRTTGYIALPESNDIYVDVVSDKDISFTAWYYNANDFTTSKIGAEGWRKNGKLNPTPNATYMRLVLSIGNGSTTAISPSDITSVTVKHPESGMLDNVVKTTPQTLTEAQKAQVRENIGASDDAGRIYTKNIGLCLLSILEDITWTNANGEVNLAALRATVDDYPEPTPVLPDGYIQHDYIYKFTGNVTNLDPLINIKQYPKIYEKGIDITFGSTTTSSAAILGARLRSSLVSDNSQSFAFYQYNGSVIFMHIFGAQSQSLSGITSGANIIKYRPQSGGATLTLNDGTPLVLSGSYSQELTFPGLALSANPVYYTDGSQQNNPSINSGTNIGNIKIYDGNTVIGNYIPCLRASDNVIGLYDVVEHTFYTASVLSYATVGNSNCIYAIGDW